MKSEKENYENLLHISRELMKRQPSVIVLKHLVSETNPGSLPNFLFDAVANAYRNDEESKLAESKKAQQERHEYLLNKADKITSEIYERGKVLTDIGQKMAEAMQCIAELGRVNRYHGALSDAPEDEPESTRLVETGRFQHVIPSLDGDIMRGFEERIEWMKICGICNAYPAVEEAVRVLQREYRKAFGFSDSSKHSAATDTPLNYR